MRQQLVRQILPVRYGGAQHGRLAFDGAGRHGRLGGVAQEPAAEMLHRVLPRAVHAAKGSRCAKHRLCPVVARLHARLVVGAGGRRGGGVGMRRHANRVARIVAHIRHGLPGLVVGVLPIDGHRRRKRAVGRGKERRAATTGRRGQQVACQPLGQLARLGVANGGGGDVGVQRSLVRGELVVEALRVVGSDQLARNLAHRVVLLCVALVGLVRDGRALCRVAALAGAHHVRCRLGQRCARRRHAVLLLERGLVQAQPPQHLALRRQRRQRLVDGVHQRQQHRVVGARLGQHGRHLGVPRLDLVGGLGQVDARRHHVGHRALGHPVRGVDCLASVVVVVVVVVVAAGQRHVEARPRLLE